VGCFHLLFVIHSLTIADLRLVVEDSREERERVEAGT
jgi:hypothetical protein